MGGGAISTFSSLVWLGGALTIRFAPLIEYASVVHITYGGACCYEMERGRHVGIRVEHHSLNPSFTTVNIAARRQDLVIRLNIHQHGQFRGLKTIMK